MCLLIISCQFDDCWSQWIVFDDFFPRCLLQVPRSWLSTSSREAGVRSTVYESWGRLFFRMERERSQQATVQVWSSLFRGNKWFRWNLIINTSCTGQLMSWLNVYDFLILSRTDGLRFCLTDCPARFMTREDSIPRNILNSPLSMNLKLLWFFEAC